MAEIETLEKVEIEQPGADPKITDRSIPYDRFKKVISEKNNLQAEIAQKEVEIENLKKKYETSTATIAELNKSKAELETIKKTQYEKNLAEWQSKQKVFEVAEGDPNYEKVQKIKHRFKLGEELQPSEVAQNLEILKTYDEIDYFQPDKNSPGFNSKKPQGSPTTQEFGGYKSIDEWARHDSEAAGKWLTENVK